MISETSVEANEVPSAKQTFINISMGQGQDQIAMNALKNSCAKGDWLMIQNVHLMTEWMLEIERALKAAGEIKFNVAAVGMDLFNSSQNPKVVSKVNIDCHKDFRCIISSVLQDSIYWRAELNSQAGIRMGKGKYVLTQTTTSCLIRL